jgi:hypothetical protein
MPITTKSQKPNGYVVFRATTDEGFALNANSVISGANTPGEVVQSMAISEAMWSVSGSSEPGFITVNRGSNTVLELTGSGSHDYQGSGIRIEQNSFELTANVDVTFSGVGVLVLKVHKVSGE